MTKPADDLAQDFRPDQAVEEDIREQAAHEVSGDPEGVEIPEELRQCGVVIDKAIGYLVEQNLPTELIASALLGGSMGVLARTTDAETMVRMLQTAIDSVRSGELLCADAFSDGE
ncbi:MULTISPECIES: hypothetical protein [Asaia]|uniref:Uncharacterized protein n=1 Tax=Asaia bogorensis NBRC 16594 TaxID=1231624 RepID=A0AAN4U3X4_9PROT|nr:MULTISPECIES: hypothetical protein [Asaia]MDL2172136.1 hypothetical protein [Asaia sp. HumB]MDR6181692.1 hypothetical protein [Asaia bogorensis NBRC 16594]BAT19360.1 hypothetical protein Asbog_01078 [Asaia bogorensis NBRC 16594]GBQ82093.1 hypothetical protein AA0311_2787 [Asaia bogorensis NBRC 16594]GEL54145.1 hypothetical protein ABO01nite_21520 [Asaia bogorensis NBRC 16594]